MHDEERDTTHPKMITELLAGILRSVGRPIDAARIWKNTREEFVWRDSFKPWHRSPMWLLVRVALQFVFSRSAARIGFPGDIYKSFMVFFISQILHVTLSHKQLVSCELLCSMNAKLVRRLIKLDLSFTGAGLDFIQKAIRNTSKALGMRWSTVEQTGPLYTPSVLENLKFDEDVLHSLLMFDQHIESFAKRKSDSGLFVFRPEPGFVGYQPETLPAALATASSDYTVYNLKALEAWVALHLKQWMNSNKGDPTTCKKLSDLIRNYYLVASPIYASNPESSSIMLLTVLELWIACDQSATCICHLLRDYDPGIPEDLFQSLVLPFKQQMERLLSAERYRINRKDCAVYPAPSIFSSFGHDSSFPLRYFYQSSEHQDLLLKIETKAAHARQEKCNELRKQKALYSSLMKSYDESECQMFEVTVDKFNDFRETHHDEFRCTRCRYKSQAASLSIDVFEWPLPSKKVKQSLRFSNLKYLCRSGIGAT